MARSLAVGRVVNDLGSHKVLSNEINNKKRNEIKIINETKSIIRNETKSKQIKRWTNVNDTVDV